MLTWVQPPPGAGIPICMAHFVCMIYTVSGVEEIFVSGQRFVYGVNASG